MLGADEQYRAAYQPSSLQSIPITSSSLILLLFHFWLLSEIPFIGFHGSNYKINNQKSLAPQYIRMKNPWNWTQTEVFHWHLILMEPDQVKPI